MKKVLLIALALITCLAAEAQLRTIKPSKICKVPNNLSYDEICDRADSFAYLFYLRPSWSYDHVDNIVASSTLKSQGSKNYRASNLHDKDDETAWVEGVKGHGIGQWIEFKNVYYYADEEVFTVQGIEILNGYTKTDKAWRENGRIKRLKVYCNGKPKCILELQNSRSLQTFNLEGLFSFGATIRFEILDVYPGTKYQDTVISEIFFW